MEQQLTTLPLLQGSGSPLLMEAEILVGVPGVSQGLLAPRAGSTLVSCVVLGPCLGAS